MLPLVLEPTWHYLVMALPLGIPLIGFAVHLIRREWREGWPNMGPPQWIAVAVMLVLGTCVLIQPIGWRLVCDRDGIALRAPLDFFATHETIAWSDLRRLGIGSTSGRSSRPTLEIFGKDGAVIVLNVLDGVPVEYWPALASAIEANAPQVWRTQKKDEWLETMRSYRPSEGGLVLGWTYRARDGEGRVYRL